jgi:hypothetical protein
LAIPVTSAFLPLSSGKVERSIMQIFSSSSVALGSQDGERVARDHQLLVGGIT